jgi:membrane protein implicated in regulation of membrane protease activity
MQELFLGPVAVWFTIPALVGTVFFSLRTLSMLVGGAESGVDADFDVDLDVDVDVDMDAAPDLDVDSGDSSHAFKILSLQAIAAFLMGFGWGGLGAFGGGGWPLPVSVLFAVACGAAMVWLLAKLLRAVYGLQSSGNVPMYHALEAEGTVYSTVPAQGHGAGRVRVVIGDRERYYKAITEGEALPTSEKVRVVGVNEDDNSVTVTRA